MDDIDSLFDCFERDGATCIRGAFGREWIDLAARGIERNITNPGPFFRNLSNEDGGFLSDMWTRRTVPEFERFCMESPAAGIAACALRAPRVRLAQDVWFLKQPGTSACTPWHHDAVVAGPFCSIWVALDPTPRAAALEFVRGSHAWGRVMMPRAFFEATRAAAGRPAASATATERFYAEFHGDDGSRTDAPAMDVIPDIDADRSAFDIVGWDMEPGDCVVFDTRTIHGAPGNATSHPIRRFVTRWVTDEATIAPHGQTVIDALTGAGLEIELRVGQPIRGALFPEVAAPSSGPTGRT